MNLQTLIGWLIHYRYLVVFPIIVVEGPITTVICGFLLRLGYFYFWPLYILAVTADLLGDLIWYALGRFAARWALDRYGHVVGLDRATLEKIEKFFREHQKKAILISKMTMGFGFALVTLITAGATKVKLKNFILMNTLGGLFWSGLLLLTGYFFGHFYLAINKGFRIVFIVVVGCIVAAALYGFKRFAMAKFSKDNL